jgi:hypothetical protein
MRRSAGDTVILVPLVASINPKHRGNHLAFAVCGAGSALDLWSPKKKKRRSRRGAALLAGYGAALITDELLPWRRNPERKGRLRSLIDSVHYSS